jgi:hypothetical protein
MENEALVQKRKQYTKTPVSVTDFFAQISPEAKFFILFRKYLTMQL